MKIKHVSETHNPHTRKRDGEQVTHVLHIPLTTDEALAISASLERYRIAKQPSRSLISTILTFMAQEDADYETLTNSMTEWRTRQKLAEVLSESNYNRALSFLNSPKNPPKEKKELPPAAKVVRRVYIPEPRRGI